MRLAQQWRLPLSTHHQCPEIFSCQSWLGLGQLTRFKCLNLIFYIGHSRFIVYSYFFVKRKHPGPQCTYQILYGKTIYASWCCWLMLFSWALASCSLDTSSTLSTCKLGHLHPFVSVDDHIPTPVYTIRKTKDMPWIVTIPCFSFAVDSIPQFHNHTIDNQATWNQLHGPKFLLERSLDLFSAYLRRRRRSPFASPRLKFQCVSGRYSRVPAPLTSTLNVRVASTTRGVGTWGVPE